ncbi:tyrosyl-DNA phosphodiesterase 1 [Pyrenophora tritici-repentis]|nr:tyrosyl-DNA phosphodiesterase 1 [Pyrenophora tritici-repentis]
MLILFRHDDTAQVVIHTANMIHRDWANMTQAIWASPQLPMLSQASQSLSDSDKTYPIGSGQRFKSDLLRYIGAYEKRLKGLAAQLGDYDFSSIRAAFIGSAPSRQKPERAVSSNNSFGWLGLKEILSTVPISKARASSPPHIVAQVSSIATLGAAPTWLSNFQSVLSSHSKATVSVPENATVSSTKASTFTKRDTSVTKALSPKFSIIFPTPEEIRNSLNGYGSGGSIHWKLQSAQQQKQLEYMHPMLCHWTSTPSASASSLTNVSKQEAHRGPAAPHIKTYIRFSDEEQKAIDWAMLTSANFSKQAWGDTVNKKEEIWIQSWETGVVVWPALFAETAKGVNEVSMVPVFGKDMPEVEDARVNTKGKEVGETRIKTTVGLRMPYDLPLKPYTADEKPWCATMAYTEPDRNGHFWPGYGR